VSQLYQSFHQQLTYIKLNAEVKPSQQWFYDLYVRHSKRYVISITPGNGSKLRKWCAKAKEKFVRDGFT